MMKRSGFSAQHQNQYKSFSSIHHFNLIKRPETISPYKAPYSQWGHLSENVTEGTVSQNRVIYSPTKMSFHPFYSFSQREMLMSPLHTMKLVDSDVYSRWHSRNCPDALTDTLIKWSHAFTLNGVYETGL